MTAALENSIKLGRAPAIDVQVTQEIIDAAIQRDSSHCVFAEAVRAYVGQTRKGFSGIAVDLQTIRFTDRIKRERYTYLTPRQVQVALVDFDQGRKPQPFTFRLRGGHTTVAGHSAAENARARARAAKKTLNEMQTEKVELAALKQDTGPKRGGAASLRPRSGSKQYAMEKVGGSPPPVSIGRRRAFGIRALDR